jgi:hypothetical protein
MKPEDSLPHSQVSAPCLYPEPDRSCPCPHTPFLKMHLNIIIPCTPGSPKWSLSLRFSPQKPCITLILLDFITRTIFGEEYRLLSSSLYNFLHSPVTSSLLGPDILLNTLLSNILGLRSSLSVSDQVSHPYKTTGKIRVFCILSFKFLDSKLEDKGFCTE